MITEGYSLVIMAQNSHSGVYLCQHSERQREMKNIWKELCSVRMLLRIGTEP